MSNLSWHQTKSITITILALLITNILSSVWWAATMTKEVDSLKDRPDLLERVIVVETMAKQNSIYLSRLSVSLDRLNTTIDRIGREQDRRSGTIHSIEKHLDKMGK